ncbi:MAG: SOS response-associated peptidase [Eubacteriales bacterium]
MCGRYQVITEEEELREIIFRALSGDGIFSRVTQRSSEVFPSDVEPVLTASGGAYRPRLLKWGFPMSGKSSAIINARSETAQEKPLFSRKLMDGRCIVPCSGFFEWTHDQSTQKLKYLFTTPGERVMFMAGLYGMFDGVPCFTILTAQANASISDIHSRMPLVLPRSILSDWLFDDAAASDILRREPPMLARSISA